MMRFCLNFTIVQQTRPITESVFPIALFSKLISLCCRKTNWFHLRVTESVIASMLIIVIGIAPQSFRQWFNGCVVAIVLIVVLSIFRCCLEEAKEKQLVNKSCNCDSTRRQCTCKLLPSYKSSSGGSFRAFWKIKLQFV